MKILFFAIAVLVSPLQSVWAASAEEEARFLAAVKTAFEKHDANALVALSCWDRVPEKLKKSTQPPLGNPWRINFRGWQERSVWV